jgi:tetratricopeptide (TPR) repeat protein/Mn-dependent DtxR family transcriptional regulator
MPTPINLPPEEVIKPIFGKKNFELIILWMLNNNDVCTWANLKKLVKPSTLSIYLKKLQKSELVVKQEFNQYSITSKGKDRFYELSQSKKKKRKLNFPPDVILWKRNYDHWILWMLYNNNFCKWADFLNEPLSINNSSLSKNMNLLIDNGFVEKENKEYRITQLGKSEYSSMLRDYDLDRQSILEEESKRIHDLAQKTIKFFNKYKITEEEVRFRFLHNQLRLPYENPKVKSNLDNEEDFYKILLYFSINHPTQYPNSISMEKFAQKYGIELVTLNYYLLQIVDKNIYPTKFFRLEADSTDVYYIQTNEKLELILNAIVEEHITKFTYLNILSKEEKGKVYSTSLESAINAILKEICGNLFKDGLREALRKFLPEYIEYLAYKVEKEKRLYDAYDKLKGLIWHEIQLYSAEEKIAQKYDNFEASLKEINESIKLNPSNYDLYLSKESVLIYFNKYDELLDFLDEILEKFPDEYKHVEIKRAYILKEKRDLEAGLRIINDLLESYPDDKDLLVYKAYWLQYLARKDEALEIIEELIQNDPENGMYHDTCGEMLMSFQDYGKAKVEFQKSIESSSNDWYVFQTYIKLGICDKELGNFELALENLKKGKKIIEKSRSDEETKQKWRQIADLFLAEIELLI